MPDEQSMPPVAAFESADEKDIDEGNPPDGIPVGNVNVPWHGAHDGPALAVTFDGHPARSSAA